MTTNSGSDASFLCEVCGYGIGGLPSAARCTECGTPTADSLPSKRIGTRWQRRPGLTGWARTNWDVLRHPKITFRFLSIVPGGWQSLLIANLVVAAVLMVEPWTGTFIGDPLRNARAFDNPGAVAAYGLSLAMRTVVVAGVLFALTWIESMGIRFIAGKRGWRIGRDAAWQICAHASVGWIVMAVLPLMTLALLFTISYLFGNNLGGWTGKSYDLSPYVRLRVSVGEMIAIGLTGGAYIVGLVVFESLVYVGVRRCCFGNIGAVAKTEAECPIAATAPPAR
jgi:hypothetical protein